ncbi:hypothetical protein ONZ45_g1820 [Pleurotus djamor]|nr:hypothetical protein ONZ45_g1820 [Pleurotus djamor]
MMMCKSPPAPVPEVPNVATTDAVKKDEITAKSKEAEDPDKRKSRTSWSRWPLMTGDVLIPEWGLEDEFQLIALQAMSSYYEDDDDDEMDKGASAWIDSLTQVTTHQLSQVLALIASHLPLFAKSTQDRTKPANWESVLDVLSIHGGDMVDEQSVPSSYIFVLYVLIQFVFVAVIRVISRVTQRLEALYGPSESIAERVGIRNAARSRLEDIIRPFENDFLKLPPQPQDVAQTMQPDGPEASSSNPLTYETRAIAKLKKVPEPEPATPAPRRGKPPKKRPNQTPTKSPKKMLKKAPKKTSKKPQKGGRKSSDHDLDGFLSEPEASSRRETRASKRLRLASVGPPSTEARLKATSLNPSDVSDVNIEPPARRKRARKSSDHDLDGFLSEPEASSRRETRASQRLRLASVGPPSTKARLKATSSNLSDVDDIDFDPPARQKRARKSADHDLDEFLSEPEASSKRETRASKRLRLASVGPPSTEARSKATSSLNGTLAPVM